MEYDFDDSPRTSRRTSAAIWNLLTILVLLAAACFAGLFLMIFINPQSGFNPFPPPTLPAALAFPSATPTSPIVLPPTWTPVPTQEPTATFTPRPTATLPPTDTPFSLVTPEAGTTTPEAASGGVSFVLQSGSPVAIANIAHPEQGCNWMGVTGQVFDMKDSPIQGQQVQLGGYLVGSPLPSGFMLTLTGLAPQYGAGYYEFTLADHPIASNGTLWIQLLDQAGLPMSEKIQFDTFNDCEKNLIVINFRQVH
jgi:hypothetical protein